MIRKALRHFDLIFLFIFSFLSRLWHLSYPPKVVFDEAHFGLYATKYFSHQYYFDIHPPLGKLLLGLFGFFGRIKPGLDFAPGSPYGDFNFLSLRALPAFLGSLLILVIYLFVKEIGFSRRVAFLSAFFLLFDNSLIVQSRLILLDIILLFFIFLSFYLFVLAKKSSTFSFRWYFLYILTGLSLGAAISIKWTGFGILGIIWFLSVLKDNVFSSLKKENLMKIGFIFFLPLLIYFLIFALHFYLVPSPCAKNCGSVLNVFLTSPKVAFFNSPPEGNLITKFFKVNKYMLASNLGTPSFWYAGSDWFSWPFMIGVVPYFIESQNNKISAIYFFGNPIVWWLAAIGLIGYFYLVVKNYLLKFKLKLPQSFYSQGCEFLVLGYLVYFLPHASIPRFMLMYHYLPALVFSVILFSVFFEGVLEMIFGPTSENKLFFSNKKANLLFLAVLIMVFFSFCYFSPLTYGIPLAEKGFQNRMWLENWQSLKQTWDILNN